MGDGPLLSICGNGSSNQYDSGILAPEAKATELACALKMECSPRADLNLWALDSCEFESLRMLPASASAGLRGPGALGSLFGDRLTAGCDRLRGLGGGRSRSGGQSDCPRRTRATHPATATIPSAVTTVAAIFARHTVGVTSAGGGQARSGSEHHEGGQCDQNCDTIGPHRLFTSPSLQNIDDGRALAQCMPRHAACSCHPGPHASNAPRKPGACRTTPHDHATPGRMLRTRHAYAQCMPCRAA